MYGRVSLLFEVADPFLDRVKYTLCSGCLIEVRVSQWIPSIVSSPVLFLSPFPRAGRRRRAGPFSNSQIWISSSQCVRKLASIFWVLAMAMALPLRRQATKLLRSQTCLAFPKLLQLVQLSRPLHSGFAASNALVCPPATAAMYETLGAPDQVLKWVTPSFTPLNLRLYNWIAVSALLLLACGSIGSRMYMRDHWRMEIEQTLVCILRICIEGYLHISPGGANDWGLLRSLILCVL